MKRQRSSAVAMLSEIRTNKSHLAATIETHLGILDWGIGGIGLWQRAKQAHPGLAITYWSDAGCTPYGKLASTALRRRIYQVAIAMRARGVTHLAVACNAASTVLPLADADPSIHLPVMTGVIEHGLQAVANWHQMSPKRMRPQAVGIVGGRRTITSCIYRRGLASLRCTIHQRVAQPVSGLIERGELRTTKMTTTLDQIMRPLANINALVLACTHYPAIADQFAARAPQAVIIDPAQQMWTWMQQHWAPANARQGQDRFVTTGNAADMKRGALAAFGVRLPASHHVRLA